MTKAAIDIGTNTARLLVVGDDSIEVARRQVVVGLGRGVDATGVLDSEAIERTVSVLEEYAAEMSRHGVDRVRAVATSATRDAANREDFLDAAETVLGVRPEMISGTEEASLSFAGATRSLDGNGPFLVVDIGGGSTEFVRGNKSGVVDSVSVDMGSVRLTDRMLANRPVPFQRLVDAHDHVEAAFEDVWVPDEDHVIIGVAGTWTSLGAMALELPAYDRAAVHHSILERYKVDHLVQRLAASTIEQTAQIPSLDPARAPVILGGAVIAREVMRHLATPAVLISEHDLLDGIVAAM